MHTNKKRVEKKFGKKKLTKSNGDCDSFDKLIRLFLFGGNSS